MATKTADNGAMPLNVPYIKRRREQLGLTQQQCAEIARFPNSQKWSNYENGRIRDLQLSTLERIAKALRCTVARLVTKG
jgi:transcriptional regulator with XRE-family HTH domain